MATKRIIQLPTLNQNNQITWSSGKTFVTTTNTPWAIATSSSWWPTTDGGSYVDYNATTDQSGNVIGGSSGRITYDSWGKQITNTVKPIPTMWTNKSVAVMNANKNGATSSLPQATPANLPWVTKYAGIDKNYWNNQAGIDLVNKQNELDTLSKAEKAQRLAGAYNPTPPPTVATAQNPVIKKTMDKPQEQTVTPAAIQGADINTLNSTLDELKYKVNVEGKQLTKEEYMTFESAKRQLQDMMKPQALTGWLDSLITNKENEIKQVTDESKINNDQELADFTRSQEVYKQAEIDAINQADEEQKKTLWFILGWQGAGQGTFAAEQIGKITQNTLAKKQALNEAVQAKIDLYGSQLRKDSQQTIQAMKDRLDSYYMKAAEFDVDNIKQMNEYNQREWASKIEQIDKMMALAQSQAMAMQPLTEQEKAQAQAFAGNLYDNEWNFQNNVFEMLYKVNPKLANQAVLQGTAIQKERLSNDMAMKWLDADIKRAQLNKLLNPEKPDETFTYEDNGDWTFVAKGNRWTIRTVDSSWWVITGTTKSWVPISQAIQTALDKCKNWAQCGKFVNDVLETVGYGRMIWDSYDSKVQTINKIGIANTIDDIATWSIFAYPVKNSSYWHIGIVTWKNTDWTINIMDYNYKWDEQQRERTNVNPSEIFNLWWSISKPIVVDSTVQTVRPKLTPAKQSAIQDALTAIEQLETTPWKSWAVWWSFQKYLPWRIKPWEWQFIPWTDAATFEARFNNLRDQLTLPNLDKLKGAMSDKDIQFLRNTSAALSLDMSEAEFDKSLKQVKEKFQNMLWVQPQEQVKWWSIDDLRNDL